MNHKLYARKRLNSRFFYYFFTRPTKPIYLLENDRKHKNKRGWPNIASKITVFKVKQFINLANFE